MGSRNPGDLVGYGLTTQWIDNKVREYVWKIAQPMSIINKHGTTPEQWDLLIDSCIAGLSYLQSQRLHWKLYMANKTILDGQKFMAALDEVAEDGFCQGKNMLKDTQLRRGNKSTLVCISSP